ncbi:hypothetical protein [uncultured Sulfitobacter sp.]|uniref:hypothetical protein n=1 Tax=uncultured Sulfitobacter sp. TaxID=191468 RepID=UPI002605DAD1|nr:hypothetical protein [uncultured Sulfitobacter sp.]
MTIIACPVALNPDGATRRIAVYQTPDGTQHLVKTIVPTADKATRAAAQALYTVSTLETRAALPIGTSSEITADEVWHFTLCRIAPPIREQWKHVCADTSALLQFSWMTLDIPLNGFTETDKRALDWIKATL